MAQHIDYLIAFIQSARLGSFSEAAKLLGTSSSTVSRKVAKVELDYGQELFIRSGKSLSLNRDGHDFFQKIEKLSFEFDSILDIACDEDVANRIKIFAGCMDNLFIIKHALPSIAKAFPELRFEFCSHTRYCLTELGDYLTNYLNYYDFIFLPEENISMVDDEKWETVWTLTASKGIYISPSHIFEKENIPEPKTLNDLKSLQVHKWRYESDTWELYDRDGKKHSVDTQAILSVDSYVSLCESLSYTSGAALIAPGLVNSQGLEDTLQRIQPDLQTQSYGYHAFVKKNRSSQKDKATQKVIAIIREKIEKKY